MINNSQLQEEIINYHRELLLTRVRFCCWVHHLRSRPASSSSGPVASCSGSRSPALAAEAAVAASGKELVVAQAEAAEDQTGSRQGLMWRKTGVAAPDG